MKKRQVSPIMPESNEPIRFVAPSTEPVDKDGIIGYAQEIAASGADFLHCDVMDGIAVKKVTYNERTIGQLKRAVPQLKLDVHLMTAGGASTVKRFVHYKPYAITVQYDFFEYEKDLIKSLKAIKKAKIKCGISISPTIPISYITPYLKYIDIILVMGVKPGLGGQKLLPETLHKVKEAKLIQSTLKKNLMISFDGGVNFKNSKQIYEAGANCLVSGSTVYNSFDRAYAIKAIKMGEEPIVQ